MGKLRGTAQLSTEETWEPKAARMHSTLRKPRVSKYQKGDITEAYQTVHLKEFTDFPKKDEKDPTEVFTDIHFEKKSVAHEAYHLSHGFYH